MSNFEGISMFVLLILLKFLLFSLIFINIQIILICVLTNLVKNGVLIIINLIPSLVLFGNNQMRY